MNNQQLSLEDIIASRHLKSSYFPSNFPWVDFLFLFFPPHEHLLLLFSSIIIGQGIKCLQITIHKHQFASCYAVKYDLVLDKQLLCIKYFIFHCDYCHCSSFPHVERSKYGWPLQQMLLLDICEWELCLCVCIR